MLLKYAMCFWYQPAGVCVRANSRTAVVAIHSALVKWVILRHSNMHTILEAEDTVPALAVFQT